MKIMCMQTETKIYILPIEQMQENEGEISSYISNTCTCQNYQLITHTYTHTQNTHYKSENWHTTGTIKICILDLKSIINKIPGLYFLSFATHKYGNKSHN